MKKGSIKLSDINFLDPGLQENPYEAYEVLRKEAPVYLSPDTGFFVVSKYNDLKRVLTDFEFFSRDLSGYWDKEIKETIIWPEKSFKLKKLNPFIKFNLTKCKFIMKEVFV